MVYEPSPKPNTNPLSPISLRSALIRECQELAAAYDSENHVTVNSACSGVYSYCYLYVESAFLESGVGIVAIFKHTLWG